MLARKLDQPVLATLAVSGAVLAVRAIHGPFHLFALSVNSPVNAQSVFGLSLAVLFLLHSRPASPMVPAEPRRPLVWLALILVITGAVLWRAMQFPLVFDDYTLARYGQQMTGAMARYYLSQPGGDGFYRPAGYLSLALDSLWADHNPLGWHVLSLALHLINMVLVWLLARRLLQNRAAALWAAALFGLHGTVLLTATFLAARFDVLAVFFVLAALALFLRYLQAGDRLALAGSLVCACLGCLSKEIAFSFPLLALLVSGRHARARWCVLACYFALAGAIFSYRFWLFGGIGGYRDALTGKPAILQTSFLGLVKGFALRVWSVFDFPINWSHRPEFWLVLPLLAYLGTLGWMALRARAPRPILLLTLGITGVSLLPAATLLLVDSTLLGASRFYLASAGVALFLASALQGMRRPVQMWAAVVLIGFQVTALEHNLAIWGAVASLADRTCAEAAQSAVLPAASSLPVQIDGVPFLRNGFEACVAFHLAQLNRPPAFRAAQ